MRAGLLATLGVLIVVFPLQMFRALVLIGVVTFIVMFVASMYQAIYGAPTDDVDRAGSVVTRWIGRQSDSVDPAVTADKVVFANHNINRRASAFFTLMLLAASIALLAADVSLRHGLAMADAIVYATAKDQDAEVVTGDADLKDLPGVVYVR